MTIKQFEQCFNHARKYPNSRRDLSVFLGYGLPGYKSVTCTIDDFAALISYQCRAFDGSFDMVALSELCRLRLKFTIV